MFFLLIWLIFDDKPAYFGSPRVHILVPATWRRSVSTWTNRCRVGVELVPSPCCFEHFEHKILEILISLFDVDSFLFVFLFFEWFYDQDVGFQARQIGILDHSNIQHLDFKCPKSKE